MCAEVIPDVLFLDFRQHIHSLNSRPMYNAYNAGRNEEQSMNNEQSQRNNQSTQDQSNQDAEKRAREMDQANQNTGNTGNGNR